MYHKKARKLRKSMTDAEQNLWFVLRDRRMRDCKFRRQHPIGNYIVDFVCLERRLVLEIDGGQHAERTEEDAQRTDWLEAEGYCVMRFWNHEVLKDLDAVKQAIWNALE
jgi:very-short-patch-repair endonuclease